MSGPGERGAHNLATVVCVDPDHDESSVHRALETGLSPPVEVTGVETAAAARSVLAERSVDCVVIASRRHRSDGPTLAEDCHRLDPALPVILYAREGSEALAAAAVDAGVSAYVSATATEPTDGTSDALEELCDAVEAALEDESPSPCRQIEAMHEVALEFERYHDPEAVYELAVDAMNQVLQSDASALYVESDGVLHPAAIEGPVAVDHAEPVNADEGVAGQTFNTGESAVIRELADSTAAQPIDDRLRSGISVPVGSLGVLQAASTTPNSFSEHDRVLGELLGAHVAAAIARIRSEAAVKRERDRFAALFDNVPDAVVLTGEVGSDVIVDVNPAFEATFGYDADELIGNSLEAFIVPEGQSVISVYETVGLGEVFTNEVTRETAAGTREFLFRGFAIELDDEIHEYAIYTDITDRKRWERELEQYQTLVESVGDPMYILDESGVVEVANDAMIEALGHPRERVVGTHAREYFPEEAIERGRRELREILEADDRKWGTFELTFPSADGDAYIAEDNVSPIVDDDGELLGSVGVIRDISDRKQRERRIRRLHEGTRELMAAEHADEVAAVGCTIATDILDYRLVSIYRYNDEREVLLPVSSSEGALELFEEPPSIERGERLAWDAFETGEPMAYGDVSTHQGVKNPETPIRSEAHLPLGAYGLMLVASRERNDFDRESLALASILAANVEAALERAERESELDQRRQDLERQNERLEEFAGSLSHDLRNPLTLASGHLDLARHAADAETTEHLEEIDWALQRMDDLIDDVLVLARSGRQLTDTVPVDLEDAVAQARRTVDSTLDVEVERPLPTIRADENRLLVLFENLFRNAIEHAGTDVTVTVGPGVDGGGFYVADDGPGIPPEERESVLESGYTTRPDGTGFGLAIVSEVAEAHGWELTIAASASGGVKFELAVGSDLRVDQSGDPPIETE